MACALPTGLRTPLHSGSLGMASAIFRCLSSTSCISYSANAEIQLGGLRQSEFTEIGRLGRDAVPVQSGTQARQQSSMLSSFQKFPGSDYQAYIHTSKYAKWLDSEGRRESWNETVGRYFDYMEEHLRTHHGHRVAPAQRRDLEAAVAALDVMPSMRALMTAGPALRQSGIAAYNCSYLPIDAVEAFHEILYILMHGTGVGFSVERQFTDKLPIVAAEFTTAPEPIYVGDSREGWSRALRALTASLYDGTVRELDTRDVRPEGAILRTFGGLASGPRPLHELHAFMLDLFRGAAGRRLTPLECHDLVCKIGEIVVVGGVRRSALISLTDLSDPAMRDAKAGPWWEAAPWRYMANISAVYEERPTRAQFDAEWGALVASGSGERGLFSRAAAAAQCRANRGRAADGIAFGTNPCSEIILRPGQFCNLSEVVVRAGDSLEDLRRKVRAAATIGTWQSTMLHWLEGGEGLRPHWRRNTVEERLLGVSMTGIMDNELTSGQRGRDALGAALRSLRDSAVAENALEATALGISPSAAVTCVKPSGTVSQLVDSASGIHARHARWYIRRVRGSNTDPLSQFMAAEGVPNEPCAYNKGSTVFSFPVASPAAAIVREDLDAISHLELCLDYNRHWCEHKTSVTISVQEHEWAKVGDWVYDHFDELAGVSFLPFDTGTYQQTPYEEVDAAAYAELAARMPARIDWGRFQDVERGWRDHKVGQELACSSQACESVGELLERPPAADAAAGAAAAAGEHRATVAGAA
eukprot:jgi/Ulvmu1/11693/UM008_0103.1